MSLTLLIIIALLVGMFLQSKDSHSKKEKKMIKEMETKMVSKRDKTTIAEEYFVSRMDTYLRKKYPKIKTWEFLSKNPFALHYAARDNKIKLVFPDGMSCAIYVSTDNVFGRSPEPPRPIQTQTPGKTNIETISKGDTEVKPEEPSMLKKVRSYLLNHAERIENAIDEAKKSGCGFYAYVEVDKETALPPFMQKLCEVLQENTGYDVSFQENTLEIGFQNFM